VEREVNCTAADKGESNLQALYTATVLNVLQYVLIFGINISFIEVTSMS
jgi:hypothetical protein